MEPKGKMMHPVQHRNKISLGCLLAALWSCTAAFRFPGPSQASILKGLGRLRLSFERLASSFDVTFATPRISSHNAFKNAVTTLCHLLRLFVSPLQRGGTCAAHGILKSQKTYNFLSISVHCFSFSQYSFS